MKIYKSLCGICMILFSTACDKFLEVKPDIKMVIPKSLEDAELLLNDYTTMNTGYPIFGEWSADEYYISAETFDGTLNYDQRNVYTWQDVIYDDASQWQRPYKAVFNANQAIEIINNATNEDAVKANNLLGIAHFFRAFAFQQLVEVFSPAYQLSTASTEMGIPLRLSPNIDVTSTRASVQQTYEQIIRDYTVACRLLPLSEKINGRPWRASAYAGLARTMLVMGQYENAYAYADSCLQLKGDLIDFNTLNQTSELPIPKFNIEVLFPAVSTTAGPMSLNDGLVDSMLYKSYADNDLRKTIFFRENVMPVGSYGYKGSYDNAIANLFVGLTTSEIYLIKAEAAVRIGKIDNALEALNRLGEHRFKSGLYTPVVERDPDRLLTLLLSERQRELLFRGRRWSDLKRLNLEPRFQKTLRREMKGVLYQLEPNSRKYAFRLPELVVNNGNIPQNIR